MTRRQKTMKNEKEEKKGKGKSILEKSWSSVASLIYSQRVTNPDPFFFGIKTTVSKLDLTLVFFSPVISLDIQGYFSKLSWKVELKGEFIWCEIVLKSTQLVFMTNILCQPRGYPWYTPDVNLAFISVFYKDFEAPLQSQRFVATRNGMAQLSPWMLSWVPYAGVLCHGHITYTHSPIYSLNHV